MFAETGKSVEIVAEKADPGPEPWLYRYLERPRRTTAVGCRLGRCLGRLPRRQGNSHCDNANSK